MRQTVETSERAWVTVKTAKLARSLALAESPIVILELTNSGRSPALDAVVAGTAFSRAALLDKDLSDEVVGAPGSRMVIGAESVVTVLVDASEPVTRQEQIDAIRSGKSKLYATGSILYMDVFSRRHRTTFCFVLKGADIAGASLAACDRSNTAD